MYKRHEGMGKRKGHHERHDGMGHEGRMHKPTREGARGERYHASGAEEHPSRSNYGIMEDHSKNAGVPTEVKIHHISDMAHDYLTERYDDTIKGIDARLAQGGSKLKGKFSSQGRKC